MNAHSHFLTQLIKIKDALTDVNGSCPLEPQPCRVGVYPAGEVPLDSCGADCSGAEGMLWVNLQPSATPNAGASPGCVRFTLTGQVGVTRCSAPLGNDGLPDVGAVEANAAQQALDADRVANAILCCPDVDDEARMTLNIGAWTPIDNQGSCYGGYWTVSAVYDVCCS